MAESIKNKIKRVGLLIKTHDPMSVYAISKVINFLKNNDYEFYIEETSSSICKEEAKGRTMDISQLIKNIDLLMVLGGDGTFLMAARLIQNTEIPIFGINLGKLGFLTEITIEEIESSLNLLKEDNLQIDKRSTIKVKLMKNKKEVAEQICLNDAVINKSAIARIINIELSIDDEIITRYKADGLIISTPTGSTAYSLSAGGSIVHPAVNAFLITPICPHMLTQRPIIIPDEFKIKLKLLTPREEVVLTLDGQIAFPLEFNDEVLIEKNQSPILIIKSPFKSYFSILRNKLKWGEF